LVDLKATTTKLDIFPGQNDELPKNANLEERFFQTEWSPG